MNLENKVVVLTTLPNMVPVGTMIKEKISSLYAADVAERTLRDELLEKGLIKKVEQVVVETATEEVVEETPEVNIHDLNVQIIELEGIERAFNNIEYLNELFDKRIASGDFRVTSPEETLVDISLNKIQGYNLDEVKGEIRALKVQKRELLKEIEAQVIESEKIKEATVKAKKAAAKDQVTVKQVIKEIITEDVAEATEMDETIVHKVLVRITRQRSAAKARAALAAKRAQAKAKAQATNVFALLGLNLEVLSDVVELMNHTNVSMKEAWTWFHKYSAAPAVTYERRFV